MTAKKQEINNPLLTEIELNILKWVQEGKTNEEIGVILGRTKWTVKFHMKNIMKKLDVTNRAQAVSQSIAEGLIRPVVVDMEEDLGRKIKIGIVGLGKGGTSVLDILREYPAIDIIWVADINANANGLAIAKTMDIPVFEDYREISKKEGTDIILNVTGENKITDEIKKVTTPETEVMGSMSARVLWQLVEERRKRGEERDRMLKQHEALYHLGLLIESIDSIEDAAYAIVDYATKLTNTPAGSLALFDEKQEMMVMAASKGFSSRFKKSDKWELRPRGLTSFILNHNGPLYIADIAEMDNPNSLLLKEGVTSLLAAPLMVENRIVGILYVNDFKHRGFRSEDMSLFSLLSIYAALTMNRVKSIEEMRLLSITDGLTGLYNQSYLMEQIKKEIVRAGRHKRKVSVVIFDIDNFKEYNDSYGHLEGNKVLKEISRMLVKECRETDTVGRFGGEEFCLVLPELDKENVKIIADRLCKDISKMTGFLRKVTVSGGVATYPNDAKSHNMLFNKADTRLYKAKGDGKNKVVFD